MRVLLVVVMVIVSGCATPDGPRGERTSSAVGTMAVGGGFIATGSTTILGAAISAGVLASNPVQRGLPAGTRVAIAKRQEQGDLSQPLPLPRSVGFPCRPASPAAIALRVGSSWLRQRDPAG